MNITFRQATTLDIPTIKQVALASWIATYSHIFSQHEIKKNVDMFYEESQLALTVKKAIQKRDLFSVALHNEKLIGFVHGGPRSKNYKLFRLYLLPQYQRQGIGKQLLDLLEDFFKEKKIKMYECTVHQKNTQAVKFYQKNGFTLKFPEADDYVMQKVITL